MDARRQLHLSFEFGGVAVHAGTHSEMGVALRHVITCEPLKIPRGERESQLHPDKICL